MPGVMDILQSVLTGAAAGAAGAATGSGVITLPGGAQFLDMPFRDLAPQGSSGLFEPFRATMAGHRAQRFVAVNPTSGRTTWFGPLGNPLLFTGDRAAARRFNRYGARRRRGGR